MRYKKNWEDMSDYLVHFSSGPDKTSAYKAMMGILHSRQIKAINPFGFAKKSAPNKDTQKCVCLSETPLHLLERISEKRGPYGIGFSKSFIAHRGGNPILYALQGSPLLNSFENLLIIALEKSDDFADEFWEIAPFIDKVISNKSIKYEFEWEREWRHRGNLSFKTNDVSFLIIPENNQEAARRFFQGTEGDNTGPNYQCPYIDIDWSLDKIRKALFIEETV